MRSSFQIFLLSAIIFFGFSISAFAQLNNWSNKVPVTITENRGESGADYVMFIDINTQQYVTAGQMQADGDDIRFATDCNGTQLIPYWIESGINTTTTRIWLRLPTLTANSANEVYMFTGNPSATAGSSQASVFVSTLVISSNTTMPVGNYTYDWFEVQTGATLTITGNNTDIFRISAGKIVVNGTINGDGAGFTGGQGTNGNGPGGGTGTQIFSGQPATGAGGGAYGGGGGNGGYDLGEPLPAGGNTYGSLGGITIEAGSGGGGSDATLPFGALGGNGGAGVYLKGFDINVSSGTINANGTDGGMGNALRASGGGSGGGILLQGERLNINTININATGGNGGTGSGNDDGGGGGGGGRVKFFYYNTATSNLVGINSNVAGGIGGCCGSQSSGQDGVGGTTFAQTPAGAFLVNTGGVGNNYILTITGEDTVCRNSSGQTLETYQANVIPGFSYNWQVPTGGNIVSGQGTSSITVDWTNVGNHSVILTDNSGVCTISDTLQVTVSGNFNFAFGSQTIACAGEPTYFDMPPGSFNPNFSYAWDFGDSTTVTGFNQNHIYQNPGSYQVRFFITNEFGCTGTSIFTINVPAKPTPDFTFTQPTCPGGVVTFTNTSTNASSYIWDFGDGDSSNVANPTHAYATAGTYTVTLTAISTPACNASTSKSVTISANPVPNFSVSGDTLACTNLNEIYSTNIGGGNSITWVLSGGGTIVSGQGSNAIEVDWTAPGSYFVKVTATSGAGCTTSDSLQVDVDNVVNVAVPTFTQACAGEVTQFTANTPATGGPYTFFWNFGDGATSTDENPTHIFAAAGSYNVTLELTSPTNCTGTSTTNVVVPAKPIADFTATPACPGAAVTFTNNSTNAVSYEWNFGDGTTSTAANPTHAYTVAGTYTVVLTVISTPNCSSTASRSVTVSPRPTVDFAATSACPDSVITFTNMSSVSSGTITAYSWDFGDGNTSSLTNPTHAYTAAGTYQVKLSVTTNIGCKDSLTRSVTVYAAPAANLTATTPVCDDSTVTFTNTSTITTGTLSYAWAFGDGGTSTDINPTHLYTADGTYNVTLTATSNNGCVDTAVVAVVVNPNPVASFTASATTICLGDTIDFDNTSTTGAGVIAGWDFGDGNQALIDDTAYLYTATGTFKVVLAVFNTLTGCLDTTSVTIVVNEEPTAAFGFTDVCDGTAVTFTNQSTIPVGALSYIWDFGDGNTSTDINPTHLYNGSGTYDVLLTVTSNNGCQDTLTQQVTVFPEPSASFTVNSPTACDNDTVFFINTSVIASLDIEYTWDFGDGNTSNEVNPAYVYGGPGTYTITLTATDTLTGCTDGASTTVTIFHRPVAAFTTADVCIGTAASFTNGSTIGTGTMSYFWDFGDTTFSTNINPTHVYDTIGIKTITLVVTSNNGCTDTTTRTLIVHPEPVADFSVGPTCFGNPTDFTNLTTIAFGSNTFVWNFGDGVTSTDSNATHTYSVLGNYTVTLTATSNAGCTHSVSQVITVHPNPTANFNRANVCEDDAVVFENTSTAPYGTLTSFWEFGDGFTSIDENPSYTYTGFGTFNVTLISTTNHGCADTVIKPVTIYPKPIAAFDVEDVCIGEEVQFDNISAVPNNGSIADIKWFFGDGAVSFENSPSHLYANPGIYEPFVVVTSTQGCIDTLKKTVVVHDLPPSTIQALGPLAFCDGGSVELRAPAGQGGYLWSTGETTQSITVSTSGTYSVTVTSLFNCTSTSNIEVTAWPLPIANAGNDTTISKGYTAQLNGSGGVDYEWTPTESLDNASIADPIAKPLVTTTYMLLVTDANGCQDTDSVTVFVDEDFLVEATNALTPNGDGKNDFWYIINIETYPDVEVLIFDRWGTQVYESKAYQNNWDGTYKDSKLPEGTYYYVIRFEGSDRLYKGAVNILR